MKYLVIDSLARSGTTLFSSMIRSQDGCVSFDGTVMESLAVGGLYNTSIGQYEALMDSRTKLEFSALIEKYPLLHRYRDV